jgi:hypothetical protein
VGKGQVQGPQPRMEEGSRNSYVKIEPNAGCMAQYSSPNTMMVIK